MARSVRGGQALDRKKPSGKSNETCFSLYFYLTNCIELSTGRQSQSTVEVDSATPITLPVIVRSKVFSQALELLSSMQSAPSCNRVATTKLLTACKSIEGPSPTVESTLDDIRSLYAAQLAVCELQDAGSQMPPHCSFNLLPESSRSAEDYGELDANQLRQCLVSLESRPQWWTSYSNNKQNAVVLCQATRVEIEKDDIIKLYKSMASTTSNLEAALVETVQQASRQIAQQRRLATIIESVQQKALHDLEASNTQARSYLSHMKQAFTSAMEAVRVKVSSIMLEVEDDMLGLSKSLKESNIDATDLEKNIGRIFEQVVQSSSGLAATQAQQWDTNLVIAAKLQNSLEMMRGHEMDALLSTFGSLHDQLETTNTLMTKMYLRQKVLDDKLSTLDTSFEKLATKAIAFQALQTRQADTQGRIYDQMHTSMQLTSARLAAIDASALDVSTKIRNLTSMMSQLASLMGAFGTVMKWKWLVLVVLGVARFNSRTAVSIAGIIGIVLLSTST
ncbi:hypothetical protein MMC19_006200 [Ptychographa xylographoides]|nr:hypothetical protein [Ptychographa xylographoides]